MEQKPSAPPQAGFEATPLSGLDKFRRNGCFNFEISDIETYVSATEEEKELLRDSTELQPALQKEMEGLLANEYINSFQKLIALNLHTPETVAAIQPALQKGMEGLLAKGYIDDFKELLALNLHTPEMVAAIQPVLQRQMKYFTFYNPISLEALFALNVHTPETLQSVLQEVMGKYLANGNFNDFKKLIAFNLHTPETLQWALQKGMEGLLVEGYIESFKKLIALNLHTFNIQDISELQPVLQKGMESLLAKGYIDHFKELLALNLHTPETLESALQEVMRKYLANGNLNGFQELTSLNLYQGDVHTLFVQVIEKRGLTKYLNFLESFAPGFTEKLYTQISVFGGFMGLKEVPFDLFKQTLEQNPFLARALNHPYGARLLTKYPQFDTISHEAIHTLFTIQERSTNAWDTNEYRFYAQDILSKQSYNRETLNWIQSRGIHLESWLHQDEEVYFSLGKEDDTGLGERITTPIKRLNETVDKWKNVVGGVLKEYKEELKNVLYVEDTTSLQEEKEKMEARLHEVVGDEKKSQGIKKGIANLEARIAKPKQIQLWNKLTRDVVGIEHLGKELVVQNTTLIEQEEKLKTLSPKEAVSVKKELKALEQTLRELVNKLQLRFDTYYTNLIEVLTPVLTKDRVEALVQEMKEKLLEDQDHYQSDIRALRELFVQDKENDSKLEGRPMRIRLASRHTNDLYVGNFTDCCVAIDNDYHGDESPIADYLTDLAVQIVLIEDVGVEPAMPVAAAWTFLGEDVEGNVSMVIDNIEGRGAYCASFKSDLEKRLGEYMEKYAKACGVGLSQGTQHNDLVVTTVDGQDKYKKLGACTRLDGYYLEAEDDSDYDGNDEEYWYEEVGEGDEGVWDEELDDDGVLSEGEEIQNRYDMSR